MPAADSKQDPWSPVARAIPALLGRLVALEARPSTTSLTRSSIALTSESLDWSDGRSNANAVRGLAGAAGAYSWIDTFGESQCNLKHFTTMSDFT